MNIQARHGPAIQFGIAGLTCLLALLSACAQAPRLDSHLFSGRKLGTNYNVKVVATSFSQSEQRTVSGLIVQELDRINSIMSTYQDTSELSLFNQAPGGELVRLSPELFKLFAVSREIGEATGGAFDITVGPLVNAWGFGPKSEIQVVPSPKALDEIASYSGWKTLDFDEAGMSVRKSDRRVYCDLSGIAKGYAVDCVSAALLKAGFGDHMVEVGGEVQARGSNASGAPWKIGVERPVTQGSGIQRVLPLANLAMATSGDYRNYFEKDGVRYSHIIDPRSGVPIRHRLASVSVVDESCMRADAFATALMVLGDEEGLSVAENNGLAALFLVRAAEGSFSGLQTTRFTELFGAGQSWPATKQ